MDCDPGIDDDLAIFMALASDELDVVGITTVSGNVPVEITSENALKIVELAGKEVEICKGAFKPLFSKEETGESVHGKNGIGGVILPTPKGSISRRKPCEMIYEKAVKHEGQLEIIASGPLTN